MLYYLLFIGGMIVSQINSVALYKKYQLIAGTALRANVLYMIVNGVISALAPGLVLLISRKEFQVTPYSLVFATATVICSAISLILMLKVYEKGQIAIINILVTVGGIILPCLWGVLFLNEELSGRSIMAILIMIGAVFFVIDRNGEKIKKDLIWMCVVIVIANCMITMLGKQHQIEVRYDTVDTLSFSIWVGVIRTILFGTLGIPYLVCKAGWRRVPGVSKSVTLAVISSVVSSCCYIITLVTAMVLPVVITSPLGTGIGMVMSSFLPWVLYREKLKKKQIVGVILSFIGVILFLV